MSKKSKEDRRSRLWIFIAYPESLPDNWLDIISEWHISCCVSPLHDRDINAAINILNRWDDGVSLSSRS